LFATTSERRRIIQNQGFIILKPQALLLRTYIYWGLNAIPRNGYIEKPALRGGLLCFFNGIGVDDGVQTDHTRLREQCESH